MNNCNSIKELVFQYFGKEGIFTASVGGSATFALDTVGVGFPEALSCAGKKTVVGCFTEVETPFGNVPIVKILNVGGKPVVRVPYHGWRLPSTTLEHTLATFWCLYQLGVGQIVVDASVGGIKVKPWDVVVPDELVVNNPAKIAAARLGEALGKDPWVRMANPFCIRLRRALAYSVRRFKTQGTEEPHHPLGDLIDGGIYVTTPLGPFETPAEIRDFREKGYTVVGQSSGQEALAARICGMCIAVVNPVANFAEGLEGGAWTPGPGGMQQLYSELAIPMAVVVYWTLQWMVKNENRCGICQQMVKSADLSMFTRDPFSRPT